MTELAFPSDAAAQVVRVALDEDLGGDPGADVTVDSTIPRDQLATARVMARAGGVVAGIPVVTTVFAQVSTRFGLPTVTGFAHVADGDRVHRGDELVTLHGPVQTLLVGERTMLNILCRLSGVATHTRQWADRLDGSGAMVLDTRKTTPGLRALEKYAVRAGGGTNKRMGLYDVAMVKDNHKIAAGSLTAAYRAVRQRHPEVPVQVEVTTVAEAVESVAAGARFLLCDNMSLDQLRETVAAVRATGEVVELEATGGLTLDAAADYAATGVDYLSVGGLTHSSPILDIALDLDDR